MQKAFEGKIALVTGASRGIGRGIAVRLAQEGVLVAVHYGSRSSLADEVVSEIAAAGGSAFAIGSDLGSATGVDLLLEGLDSGLASRTETSGFDILVNNAGIGISTPFGSTDEREWDRLLAVNIKAPYLLAEKSLHLLRDGGSIINISSATTRIAHPPITAYSLTKGAINTLTLHLAKMLAPRGINVNAILPGLIRTEMNAAFLDTEQGRELAAASAASGRIGVPSDIADLVGFLTSQKGSFVTGQLIEATGGAFL